MSVIDVRLFDNTFPAKSPRLISNETAQTATNCDLSLGFLFPTKALTSIQSIAQGDCIDVYKLSSNWLAWASNKNINVVKAQLTNFTFGGPNANAQTVNIDNRIIFTGDDYPKQTTTTLATSGASNTYPTETRRLGVKAPTTALTVTLEGSGTEASDTISYVYTYVTAWGEESAPSPFSGIHTINEGQYTKLSGFVKPTISSSGNDIVYMRVYRLNASQTGAEYQLLKIKPDGGAGFVYDIDINDITSYVYDYNDSGAPTDLSRDLGEVLPSTSWLIPPEDTATSKYMQGLVQYQNNVLCGFYENQVCFSEPDVYYAYPSANRYSVDANIVALGVFKGTLVVATEGYPYLFQGLDPATVTQTKIYNKYKCVNARSLVSTPYGVLYASPDGLVFLDSTGAKLITDGLLTRDQWKALAPEKFHSVYWDNKYIAYVNDTGKAYTFTFLNKVSLQDHSYTGIIRGSFVDPDDNTLYISHKDGATYTIYSWQTNASYNSYIWKSKIFQGANAVNFSAVKLWGDFTNGDATLKVYSDGILKDTLTISSMDIYRLSGGFQTNELEFQIEGKPRIDRIVIGTSIEEIKNVN